MSINAAYEVTKMPHEDQTEIAERIEQGEKPKTVVADVKRRKKQTKRANNTKKDSHEDFEVRPTSIEALEDTTEGISNVEKNSGKYKIISLNLGDEFKRDFLVKKHIENLVADDCALFVWCQYHILPEIFKAALWEKLGLNYQTVAFTSSKELCILATSGNAMVKDMLLPKIVESSKKERKDLIKELVGDVPVCEL